MGLCLGHETALELLQQSCRPGGVVVDAGAFPGTLTRHLRELGWNVLAIDKEPNRRLTLQDRFLEGDSVESDRTFPPVETTFSQAMNQIGVEVLTFDLESSSYPINSESVDGIVMTEVIEHLWIDPLHALTEANRILKVGTGTLLISTPNLLSLRNRFNFLLGRMERVIERPIMAFLKKSRLGHMGHLRLYAPEELNVILRSLGFEAVFHFFSFDYWGPSPTTRQDQSATSHALGNVTRVGSSASDHQHRSFVRKLLRSPKSYFDAGVATVRVLLERVVPSFRSHMFIVAKKVHNVDYRELLMSEVNAIIAGKNTSG